MKVLIEFELDSSWDDYKDASDEILLDDLIESGFMAGVISNTIVGRKEDSHE